MNRRGFISMLAGGAGAVLVPWRLIDQPTIFLPPQAGWIHTPLIEALCAHAELVRPLGTVVEFTETDEGEFHVLEHLYRVEVSVPRRLSTVQRSKIMAECALQPLPREYTAYCGTLRSLLPGVDSFAVDDSPKRIFQGFGYT